jgi:DNA-binding PadR family transcriptional regulator
VRAAALLLLAEGPLNGYQIMQEIEKRSNGIWRPSPGSVYPALSQLVDEGLIRSEEEQGGRRSYVITDAGRAHLEERAETHAAPWEQMADAGEGGPGALFGEMRRLGMAVGQIGHLGDPSQVKKARAILAEARRSLYSILAENDDD